MFKTTTFSCIELRVLSEKQKVPVDLDTYVKKLANSRKRILLVNDILQNVQVCSAQALGMIIHELR